MKDYHINIFYSEEDEEVGPGVRLFTYRGVA